MFDLSGVWKGDRRSRALRKKYQAAKAKGWILTTSIKMYNLLLLGSLQEPGRMVLCQPWAWISPLLSDGSRV